VSSEANEQLDLVACAQAVQICACANFRRASRAVTQLFDETLSPSGLRSTQLVILISVAVSDNPSVVRLARDLGMDRSTLARNLQPLEKQRLLKIAPGKDRRTRVISLTPKGRQSLAAALPLWEKAQTSFVEQLGEPRWGQTLENLSAAVQASHECL